MPTRAFAGFESCRLRLFVAVGLFVGLAGICPTTAFGQATYFYGGGTRTWSNTLSWWQTYIASAPTQSGTAPGANDTAIFNTSGSNAAGSVLYTSDASVRGLQILQTATGGLTLRSADATVRALTLGSGGIFVQPGNTSAVTVGGTGNPLNVTLGQSQAWQLGNGVLTISNTVAGSAASGTSQTLLIDKVRTVTAGNARFTDGPNGKLNLWINLGSAGSVNPGIQLSSSNTFTGTLTLQLTGSGADSGWMNLGSGTYSTISRLQMAGGALASGSFAFNPVGTINMLGGASVFGDNIAGSIVTNAGTFTRSPGGGILVIRGSVSGASATLVSGMLPWMTDNVNGQPMTISNGTTALATLSSASNIDALPPASANNDSGYFVGSGGTLTASRQAGGVSTQNNTFVLELNGYSFTTNVLNAQRNANGSQRAPVTITSNQPSGFLGIGSSGELLLIQNSPEPFTIAASIRESAAGGWVTLGAQQGWPGGPAAATFTLSGSNSHSGGTSILNRRLNINNAHALGSGTFRIGGNLIVLDNTTAGPLTIATNNRHEWNSDFSFAGTQDLNLGTGTVSLGTWAATVRTVTVDAGNLTVGGRIVDGTYSDLPTTRLAKAGPGRLILSGSNGYTGATEVWGGELLFDNRNALYGADTTKWTAANLVTGTGGILSVSVGDQAGAFTTSDLNTLAGAVGGLNGGYLGIDTTGVTSGTFTYGTNLANPSNGNLLGIAKTGGGTLELTGNNTFTGGVLARGGTLRVTAASQVGTGTLVAAGGLLDLTGVTVSNSFSIISGTIANTTIAANKLTAAVTGPAVISGTLTGAGANGNWTKSGTGTLVHSASNTLTGTTTLTGGLLSISSDANLNGTASALTFSGGGLQVTGTGLTSLNTGRTTTFTAAQSVTFDIADAANTFTVAQNLQQTTGGLTKSGSGTLVASGNNTYTGVTTLTGGTLRMGSATALGGTTGNLSISGGVLDLNGNTPTKNVTTITGGLMTGGTLTSGSYAVQSGTAAAGLSGTANLTKTTAGVVLLSGTNTYSGTTAVSAGILTVNSTESLPGWNSGRFSVAAGAALAFGSGFANADVATVVGGTGTFTANSSLGFDTSGANRTYDSAIGNAGSNARGLVKLGSGTLILSASNTYTGTTAVGYAGGPNSGVMQLASTGFVSPAVTIFGGTFDTAGQSRSITTLNLGGGAAGSTASLQTGSGTVTLAGNVTFTATNNPDGATIAGNLSLGAATRTFTVNDSSAAGADLTISAVIGQASAAGLTKSGLGTLVLAGANTFTGKVTVNQGTVEINSVAVAGSPSPLGTSGTIDLGSGWQPGTLRWVGGSPGSTNLGMNLSGTLAGATVDAAGTGALVLTGLVTSSGTTAKPLTLTGTSTALNTIGVVSGTNLSVVKDGPGRWRLTGTSSFDGTFTVKNGTLVAAANSGETGSGVFGTQNPVVGDTTPGATGTAALLVEAGYSIQRDVTVASGVGVSQSVLLGGASESGTVTFASGKNLNIGRDVALVARPGGTVTFSNNWTASSGTGTPTANVAIGADGYTGAVRLLTSGTLATGGSIGVRYGTAVLGSTTILDGAGTLAIDAGATLAGIGTVAGPLGGAGLVAPGNSPGILSAEAFDPTGGLDVAFEFTGLTPTYGGTANVNDILRLTGASPFVSGSLSAANVVSLYLPANVASGDVFTGGFFTDLSSSSFSTFLSSVTSGNFVAYYLDSSGSFAYGGNMYSLLANQVTVGTATVSGTTTFANGGSAVDGQVTTFTVVVPEPATVALAVIGVALAGYAVRRRRR